MNRTKNPAMRWAGLVFAAAVLVQGPVRAEEPKESPVMTALKSLKLSGYAQFYAAEWDRDTDTFSIRRARIALTGEIVKNLRFRLNVDFVKSPVLIDGVIEFEPYRAVGLRFGQFKVPFSVESLTSAAELDLINRAHVVDALCPGRDIGANGRDIGTVLYGSYSILDYAVGIFNGSGINKSDTNSHKDWDGRVVLRPAKFLAIGGSLYRGRQNPSPGAPLVRRNKEGLEAVLSIGRLSLKSEYLHAQDDTVSKSGWYAQAGFFARPGKLQALVRYETLDLDRAVANDATDVLTAGLNWHIKGRTKLQVNYERHGLEAGGREKSGILALFQAGF